MSGWSCPVCVGVAERLGERSGYEVARCRACHHSFVVNQPSAEALAAIYDRYSYDTRGIDAFPAFLEPVVARIVASFEGHRRSGRLLEVGFGAGALLRAAGRSGWTVFGVEKSALAVEQARAHGLGEVMLADFTDGPYERGSFDVVVMSELIEHVPSPGPFLATARQMLAPGGLLYLTTPHGRGISGRLLRADWSVCAPPEHLHLFSRTSMRLALEAAGFGRARIETRNVHPHELVAWARQRVTGRTEGAEVTTGDGSCRVENSYRLNSALVASRWGRAAKAMANRVLDLTTLGDGIVVRAEAGR